MNDKNKAAFWAFVGLAATLVCVPTSLLLDSWGHYSGFLRGFDEAPLRPVPSRHLPHRAGGPAQATLEFVEFSLRAPKASSVALLGDFNGWKAGAMTLTRQGHGLWSLTLPLLPGRYGYQYLVDGQTVIDPNSPETGEKDGKKFAWKNVP